MKLNRIGMAMTQLTRSRIPAALCMVGLLLAACGHRNQASPGSAGSDDVTGVAFSSLPQPQAKGGSITGMPDTPGPVPAISTLQPLSTGTTSVGDEAIASSGNADPTVAAAGSATDKTVPEIATGSADPLPSMEPNPQDAVAVIHDYYSAINQAGFAHAWALWSDHGRASGQTPQQFADGYADTANVNVQTQAPTHLDAAAGSRYIEIPVTITASRRDGSEHHYSGTYTLRRSTVDGATADQRAWRIASANLHEAPP
jgi:hypothetical protein